MLKEELDKDKNKQSEAKINKLSRSIKNCNDKIRELKQKKK